MDLFINTNLKFNKESTIYIFTNHIELKKNYQNDKIIFLFFPKIDDEIMTNRVIFNYYAIDLNKFLLISVCGRFFSFISKIEKFSLF